MPPKKKNKPKAAATKPTRRGRRSTTAAKTPINNKNNNKIDDMVEKSRNDIFEKVNITINNKTRPYCAIFRWFIFPSRFVARPTTSIEFNCLVCERTVRAPLGKPGNLKKHLLTHEITKKWLKRYSTFNATTLTSLNYDEQTSNLIKFFLNSNLAINACKDKYLRKLLKAPLGKYSLSNTIIPNIMDKLNDELEKKFQAAKYIHLVVDIWSSWSGHNHLALGCILTMSINKFERVVSSNFTIFFILIFCLIFKKY
jgi:hypothetical protein